MCHQCLPVHDYDTIAKHNSLLSFLRRCICNTYNAAVVAEYKRKRNIQIQTHIQIQIQIQIRHAIAKHNSLLPFRQRCICNTSNTAVVAEYKIEIYKYKHTYKYKCDHKYKYDTSAKHNSQLPFSQECICNTYKTRCWILLQSMIQTQKYKYKYNHKYKLWCGGVGGCWENTIKLYQDCGSHCGGWGALFRGIAQLDFWRGAFVHGCARGLFLSRFLGLL